MDVGYQSRYLRSVGRDSGVLARRDATNLSDPININASSDISNSPDAGARTERRGYVPTH